MWGVLWFGSLTSTKVLLSSFGKSLRRTFPVFRPQDCADSPCSPSAVAHPSHCPDLFHCLWWKALSVPSTLLVALPWNSAAFPESFPKADTPGWGACGSQKLCSEGDGRILLKGSQPTPGIISGLFLTVPTAASTGIAWCSQ